MSGFAPDSRVAVESAILAGQKIEAIKRYREAVPGADLAEAKTAVEALELELRRSSPEKFSAPSGKSGCLGAVLILVGLISVALMVLKGTM